MTIQKKQFLILLAPLLLLLVPFIGMQFSKEVVWTGRDFVIAGILLLCLGTGVSLALSIKKLKFKILSLSALFLIFLLIWLEMAVGIFDTPFAGT